MAIDRTDEYMPQSDAFATTSVEDRPEAPSSNAVQSGWAAAEQLTTASGDYPTEFKFVDGEFTVVKFIDQNGPFAIYKQHFLQQKTVGKKSYVSLGPNDPLCTKLGSKPEDKRAFTIAVITPTGITRQMLIASPRLYKTLHSAVQARCSRLFTIYSQSRLVTCLKIGELTLRLQKQKWQRLSHIHALLSRSTHGKS